MLYSIILLQSRINILETYILELQKKLEKYEKPPTTKKSKL